MPTLQQGAHLGDQPGGPACLQHLAHDAWRTRALQLHARERRLQGCFFFGVGGEGCAFIYNVFWVKLKKKLTIVRTIPYRLVFNTWRMMRGELALYSYTLESVAFKVAFGGGIWGAGGGGCAFISLMCFGQCYVSGSGIRRLFDPWIRDPGWGKNQDPDLGLRSYFREIETIFWG